MSPEYERNICQKGGYSPPEDLNGKATQQISLLNFESSKMWSIEHLFGNSHSLSYHDKTFVRPPSTLV